MQQLKVEQNKEDEQQIKRECKGRRLAISRRIYRLMQTDVFYVESESTDNVYYFVKFKPDVIEFCSCMDSSTRNVRCKHSFAVEYAIRMGTLKDTDKLPAEAKRNPHVTIVVTPPTNKESYRDDNYDF